jgi:hypothetical protein
MASGVRSLVGRRSWTYDYRYKRRNHQVDSAHGQSWSSLLCDPSEYRHHQSQTPIRWISAKVHDTKMTDPIAFAFSNGRVAVVYAKDGVKMWEWSKGVWAELRGIKRSGVTAIQFIHEGSALLGATADGVV